MRLINVKTGALEEFSAANIPKYAILSHTWGDDEVTFQDLHQYANAALLSFSLNPFAGYAAPETRSFALDGQIAPITNAPST